MAVPNCSAKYRSDPVVTPADNHDYFRDAEEWEDIVVPDTVALCFSREQLVTLLETFPGERLPGYYGDLYVVDRSDGRVGIAGNFGIGSPSTAIMMEELIADGAERFLSFGYAGCLRPEISPGEIVVCEKAIRDEGTSHHYEPPSEFAEPDDSLTDAVRQWLGNRFDTVYSGPAWTTDAIYQETHREVNEYRSRGILTVEMEAAAVFTVANYHDVEAAATFVVSDHLGEDGWEPHFGEIDDETAALGRSTIEFLIETSAPT